MNTNTTKIRREVLIRLAQIFFEGRLEEQIDRIPLRMRPRSQASSRCCVYKDRAVLKYRCMAALGIGAEEEVDELTSLREYTELALERGDTKNPALTILTEACSACIKTHYQITNACQGCVSRSCMVNCPKDAVVFSEGKAHIVVEKCVNCGKCMQGCPYKAIIHIPIPCEEACPTGAISKDETGREQIDIEKCIFCGKCLHACPFGAIAERSQILSILQALTGDKHTTALLAPAAIGQFPGSPEQLHGALLELGFDAVLEVAIGADLTTREEAQEFQERMADGQPFMTTSCCPAYIEAVRKFHPELEAYVSGTATPMQKSGKLAKEQEPGTNTVFIGPCLAKRKEAADDPCIDQVLTFEELGALFVAKGIDVAESEAVEFKNPASSAGRGFPMSGGVAGAVKSLLPDSFPLEVHHINGLDRRQVKQLSNQLCKRRPGNLIEVMACEGGCVAGPGVVSPPRRTSKSVEDLCNSSEKLSHV